MSGLTGFFDGIDYPLLREQKRTLLDLMDYIEDSDSTALSGHPIPRQKALDALTGLLNLIDALQDFAVDHGIAEEQDVFMQEEDK